MTPRSRTASLAAALAAAAALAGCGSSGPSQKEFVKKADALCAQTNKAHPPKPNPKSSKEAAQQQAEEVQIRKDLDRKLKALDVPSGSKKDFDAYNAGTQRVITVIDMMRADAQKNDEKKYASDAKLFEQAATAREKVAVKLGFKTCGRKNPVK
jgi:glucose/arabinose dehydrogenase